MMEGNPMVANDRHIIIAAGSHSGEDMRNVMVADE
jgi:hypothetical protein